MIYSAGASAGAAGAAAAMIQATRASGAIVRVEPDTFVGILVRMEGPLVVKARGGFFGNAFDYLTNYKGIFFYTRSSFEIALPPDVEIVSANKIWIPG